ncbi:hypothetical protein ABW21_db0200848 [Orbilia brochopaga]|nr:hypothetical protein ABW21_db0200848 [Drechslerella brochopaga]
MDDNRPCSCQVNRDPNDILNPDFLDLFIEEAPPKWTLEDRHALSVIRGTPSPHPAPFQQLPVELIEHIAYNLPQFRDIRALGSSCTLFHQVLFGSQNHFFWFRWAGAPHSLCRWKLGEYRQNRAYQNTICGQQGGKRRKRCQLCMAPAVKGMVFRMKVCEDCWEEIGMPARELYFLQSIDITDIPREHVTVDYIDEHLRRDATRDWDLLYFFKSRALRSQFEAAMQAPSSAARPSETLLKFLHEVFRQMHKWCTQIKHSLSFRYASYYRYHDYNRPIAGEKWYVQYVQDLVPPHEVAHRFLDALLATIPKDGEGTTYGNYRPLPSPQEMYGNGTAFHYEFPRTKCELQTDDAWLAEFGEDPDNLHDCNTMCHRKSRVKLFREKRWPAAEEQLLRMLIGEDSLTLTAVEAERLRDSLTRWDYRAATMEICEGMLKACRWIIPGVVGEYTVEHRETGPEVANFFRVNT